MHLVQLVSLEQDDSENWIEIQKVLRGYKARQNKLIMEMGKGNEKVREDGSSRHHQLHFLRNCEHVVCTRHWADLLIHEKWEDVEAAANEYEKELMK